MFGYSGNLFVLGLDSTIGAQGFQNIVNLVWATCTVTAFGMPALLYFTPVSLISIFVCKQSAGFSGASDATRVSILLGLLKVHVNTFYIFSDLLLPLKRLLAVQFMITSLH
jgi:hypothetical protein